MAGINEPNLNLTPEEKRAYSALFKKADTEGLGVVTGDVAVNFFERTRLDSNVLGEIWQIADTENRGLLTPGGFNQVLRLIGHCQAGRQPSEAIARQPGPLPRFDGMTLIGQSQQPSSPQSIPQQTTGPIRVPPLAPDKVNEYSALFEKAGARNGLLGGDAAKQVFEKARLPNEVLGQIWNLTDREQRGSLNNIEFVVAMHLLASMRGGAMRAIPQTLPQGLYDAAARRGSQAGVASSVPRQLTGQGAGRPQSPLARQPLGSPPVSAQSTGADWLITPQDKSRFDQSFNQLDRLGRGYITGDQAVGFFSNSGLSEDALAQIWDLADIDSAGQLGRDEFAVAMYLIRQQRSKVGERDDLPTELPPRLVPPSMRKQAVPPSHPTAPAFDNDAFSTPVTKGAAEDLFGLDALSDDSPAQQPAQQPPSARTPNFAVPSAGTPTSPQSAQPKATDTGSSFKPFVPSSAFGQGIAAQSTGGSVQSEASRPRGAPIPQERGGDDLLGDNDPEVSNKLTAETTELANMSNQIGNLRSQMTEVQNKKGATARDLSTTDSQKRELESRLAQFRTQYEQEIREVKQLEEKLNASRADTKKISQSLAMVEGSHQDLTNQHKQMQTALEADQGENANLKQKVQALNAEISQLKPQLEKLRSDARQHKGMVAINKKQVSTSEGELEKVKTEMAEHQKVIDSRPTSSAQTNRSASGSGVASPAQGVMSPSTNPFFRNASQQPSTQSPSARAAPASFDDVFGAALPPAGTATTPSTSFKNDSQREPSPDAESDSNVQTPSASPPREMPVSPPAQGTPHTTEPPAPPASRQMTSSSLPLRTKALRSESIDSSVRAVPPASRGAPSDRATPAHSDTTGSVDGDAPFSDSRTEQTHGDESAPSFTMGNAGNASSPPSSARGDVVQGPYEGSGRRIAPQSQSSIPGAFPGEAESPMPTPTPGSFGQAPPARTTSSPGEEAAPTRPDFGFVSGGTNEEPRTLNQDEAPSTSASAKPRPQSEFPSIRNLEDDEDDSESESEDGFGDSFTTTSAGQQAAPATTQPREDELPSSEATKSPPSYEQSEPDGSQRGERHMNQTTQAYGDLLPSREGATSPPSAQSRTQNMSSPGGDVQHVASIADNANSASSQPTHYPPAGAQATPLAAAPIAAHRTPATDDFDSAFDDLSEAKEHDEQGYDAFGSSTRDDHDFNPVFDSPSHSKSNTSEFKPSPSTSGSTHRPFDSFSNFETNPNISVHSGEASAQNANQQSSGTPSTSHDWDAIFSGLDSTPSTSQANGGKSPFDLDPPGSSNTKGGSSLAPGLPSSQQRPSDKLARAISAGTEHDDPILKSLTSMGYPRDDALKALEKYDYNLDKAADYLTTH
ncbi:MAG: hypothetical protein M1828_003170 [Chrysothrix sp. TS-e1954]|nr:MAG: hypothetical protein M1828_003170 [Chrysothrix sp. TS-e1954]